MSSGRLAFRAVPRLRALLATGRRGAPALRRPSPRVLATAAAALVLLVAGWFWLRDSSLVAVRTVEVSGVSGTQGLAVRDALEQAARSMTTLHVRQDALNAAVAPFSIVKRLEVGTGFPHTMRIHVVTNVAVAAIVVDGRRIAVTADGTLLRDAAAAASLPTVPLRTPPGGARLSDRFGLTAVAALGAAPEALRTRVTGVRWTAAHGLTLQLAHGPVLWFGAGDRLGAKWAAAAAVLADSQAAGASTIDVTDPQHPAVSGLPGGATTTGESDIPTPPAGTDTTATTPPSPTATTPAPTDGTAAPATATPPAGGAAPTPASPNG
jgi:cell division protein FtsQ